MVCPRGRETGVTATKATAASTTTRGQTTETAETHLCPMKGQARDHVTCLDQSASVIGTNLGSLVIMTSQDTAEDVPLIPQVPAQVPEVTGECL